MSSKVGGYTTLMHHHQYWKRADAQSAGLLEWGTLEMRMCTADSEPPQAGASSPRVAESISLAHGAHECLTQKKRRLTRDEAVAIYLAKLGPKSCKAAGRLANEFGITAKAVRDVWTDKTWKAKTLPLKAQQYYNNYMPQGAVSPGLVAAAARVQRALYLSPEGRLPTMPLKRE